MKISRPDAPGEFFKGHPIRQSFRQTFSPGVARGLAKSLRGFITSQCKTNPQGYAVKKNVNEINGLQGSTQYRYPPSA